MGENKNKKIIASFELTLIIMSMFAFSYMISDYNELSIITPKEISLLEKIKIISHIGLNKLKSPIIPVVSALEQDGCCELTIKGEECKSSVVASDCTVPIIEGRVCSDDDVQVCVRGCCYEESTGRYIPDSLQSSCVDWIPNPSCSIPEARLGCCVTGESVIPDITEAACQIESENRGYDSVDWNLGMDAASCTWIAGATDKGACVFPSGICSFGARSECSPENEFRKDYLCTAPILETSCKMTGETTCVEGRDEVYFIDDCGNLANVYDSSKIDDVAYWTTVQDPTCGVNSQDGNANSKDCGNCNLNTGGSCASALQDDFKADSGDNYCRSTGCYFDVTGEGEEFLMTGESWCMYDGKIGDGKDIPGSSHWRYECDQGEIISIRCGDQYRNSICIGGSEAEIDGVNTGFRVATCAPNNWVQCLNVNTEENMENGIVEEECNKLLNCRTEKLSISEKYFEFDICVPEYPAGFNTKTQIQEVNKNLCGIASMTCVIPRDPEFWDGCGWSKDEDDIKINKGCTSEEFTKQMNDFCIGLGDCGANVNIVGVRSDSYDVRYTLSDMSDGVISRSKLKSNTEKLSTNYLQNIMSMNIPTIPHQIAKDEDYTKMLESLGMIEIQTEGIPDERQGDDFYDFSMWGSAGIATAIYGGVALFGLEAGVSFSATKILSGLGQLTGGAAWLGPVMGAFAGVAAGLYVSEALGASGVSTVIITGGLAAAGALAGVAMTSLAFPGIGWAIAGSIALAALGASIAKFIEDDCEPIEVKFECKPWRQPQGGENCDQCNNDPLRPCNKYRCHSLGAACELENVGTVDESCIASPDDGAPLFITTGATSDNAIYSDFDDTLGSSWASASIPSGGCFNAYETIVLGINISKIAYCRYATTESDFEDMEDFGSNTYLKQQYLTLHVPDPSRGISQGIDWSEDIDLFIKCEGAYENIENIGFYKIDLCINQGEDIGAPIIEAKSPEDDSLVGFDITQKNISISTHEPATCRWSLDDITYDDMENNMSCISDIAIKFPNTNVPIPYTCKATLPTPLAENNYYINCKDQPWLEISNPDKRNSKLRNELYTLKRPNEKIKINYINPENDIETGTPKKVLDLEIKTSSGGLNHKCYYSFLDFEIMYEIIDISSNIHTVPFNLIPGKKTIYVECRDETGDTVQSSTSFEIIYDNKIPLIARVWQDAGQLHITTNEDSECKYSTETCAFDWEEGKLMNGNIEHITSVTKGETYYVKCADDFDNGKSSNTCSIQVMAV
ncbi:hypothetical protein KAS08_01775 [Candidatus Pacearchaeota archaeon]|nr:hypothetical protein [Candidatus Pacearchaeota archaeon]